MSESEIRKIRANATSLLERAENAVAEAGSDYHEMLGVDLKRLRKMRDDGGTAPLLNFAYRIKGQAGTMGWPLISAASNALAKLLERSEGIALDSASVSVHLDTLDLLYRENMKGEDERGQPLVRELYKIVEKESS